MGQKGELEGLEERAKASGASKLYIEDLTDEFVEDYVIPTMQAGADYEGYLLGTSFARPILAKRVVEIARAEVADAVCHGSTGKGNDQVRFELAIMHFAPDLKIITPWREWDIQSRDEEIDYAEAHHITLKICRETNYSKDKNLWHLSHEGLDLEDPGNEPQYERLFPCCPADLHTEIYEVKKGVLSRTKVRAELPLRLLYDTLLAFRLLADIHPALGSGGCFQLLQGQLNSGVTVARCRVYGVKLAQALVQIDRHALVHSKGAHAAGGTTHIGLHLIVGDHFGFDVEQALVLVVVQLCCALGDDEHRLFALQN